MRSSRSHFVALASALVLAAPSGAQALYVVGPGSGADFPEIQDAIDVALNGDTILVRGGTYAPVTLAGKGVIVVADAGASVFTSSLTIENLPVGRRAVFRGVDVLVADDYDPALTLRDNAGAVWIEDASYRGLDGVYSPVQNSGGDAIAIESCAAVTLVDVSGTGGFSVDLEEEEFQLFAGSGGSGLIAADSNVAVWGGSFVGRNGANVLDTKATSGGDGGSGISVLDGAALISGVSATGSGGGFGGEEFFFGQCGPGGAGGDGIGFSGSATGYVRDAVLAAGNGGAGGRGVGCSDGPDGQPLATGIGATSTTLAANHQSLVANSPVREGETITLTFTGEVNELAFFRISANPDWLLLPDLQGASGLGLGPIKIAGLLTGTAPGPGTRTLQVPLAEVTPPGEAVNLYLQPVLYDGFADELTLGSGTTLTLLDATD